MKAILYRKERDSLKIEKILDDAENKLRIIFPAPISGSLRLGKLVTKVEDGIAEIDTGAVGDGKITPCFYNGAWTSEAESFVLKHGIIHRCDPDAEYIRETGRLVDGLLLRVSELEQKVNELYAKVFNNTIF